MQKRFSPWFKPALLLALAISLNGVRAQSPVPAMVQFPFFSPTNVTPTVRLVSPHDGAAFVVGEQIHVCAAALFFTNHIATVEFFAGTNSLGSVTNSLAVWGQPTDLFCFTWDNATLGAYKLTAVATDISGLSVTSPAVKISVVGDLPPKVRLVKPANGVTLLGPTNLTLTASAYDPDGTVTQVEFFQGTNSLGVVTTPPLVYVTNWWGVFPIRSPYSLTWSNAPLGTFTLTAVATDNAGVMATSAPATISLVSDLPPRVRIEAPFNGATFRAPANIHIVAAANDADGSVTNVEFFAGTNSLGSVASPTVVNLWGRTVRLYSLTWAQAPAGSYALTAVATDDDGEATTSSPVNITVLPPPSPTVKISTPRNGATFYNAPANINVCAVERHFTNPVVKVEFFAGTNSLGVATSAPFSCIVWHQAPAGAYSLTAVATDSTGATLTSAPVGITVSTNKPPWSWGW
jgi:hypothetical protein